MPLHIYVYNINIVHTDRTCAHSDRSKTLRLVFFPFFYISFMFSNARGILLQCSLNLLNNPSNTFYEPSLELNLHFSTIGERLASEIPSSDIEPETYLPPTETSFSLTAPSLDVVYKLLSKLNESKSAGLDNIPNKLLI